MFFFMILDLSAEQDYVVLIAPTVIVVTGKNDLYGNYGKNEKRYFRLFIECPSCLSKGAKRV